MRTVQVVGSNVLIPEPEKSDARHIGEVQPRPFPQPEDDFELPAKTCDLGRPEGCESCQ